MDAGASVAFVRTGIVLAREGGAMKPLLRMARLGLAGPLGSGRQFWPWITLPDQVAAILHLLDRPDVTGPVNLAAPAPARQRDIVAALGRALHRPAVLWAPSPPCASCSESSRARSWAASASSGTCCATAVSAVPTRTSTPPFAGSSPDGASAMPRSPSLPSSLTALAVPAGGAAAAPPDVAVIGHRGSGAMAPENTLAAIRLALRQGADYIENDIMRTKDGRLVITHDLSLARTTDVEQVFPDRTSYQVADYTLAEIKQLDAGSWFGAEFAGQRILTLREWVEAVGSSAGMLLEAKDPWAFPGIETRHRQGAPVDPDVRPGAAQGQGDHAGR